MSVSQAELINMVISVKLYWVLQPLFYVDMATII